jgi:GWxTD domain-containing protein
MELARRFCSVMLFYVLAWPVVSSQQGESIAAATLADLSRQAAFRPPTQDHGADRCFDAQSTGSNTSKEQQVVADITAHYRFWLTEDVVYIIAPEERCAFLQLRSDEERDIFIEQFWRRRAPDPESLENEFQEEHYRRIVFANDKFGTDIPGWRTDRGHIYIQCGPPDEVVAHPAGEPTWRPPKDAPDNVKYSWENWYYRYLEGLGENVDLVFVDSNGSGKYFLRIAPQDKDVSLFEPYSNRVPDDPAPANSKEVRLDLYIGTTPVPRVRYKDLEAMAVSKIIRDQVFFGDRVQFVRATHASTMTTIVVELAEDQSTVDTQANRREACYEIFGRITTPRGWVVSTFERRTDPEEHRQEDYNRETSVPLPPGLYYLALIVKAVDSGKTGVSYTTFEVPAFDELEINKQ